jgi:four helix bundle protein
MGKTNFENLDVYLLSEKLSDIIWEMVLQWEPFYKNTIGIQLVKSSDSIGANIAEGLGRGSSKENKRFAKIARGSLFETKHWLRRTVKRRLIGESSIKLIKPLIDELSPRLSAYINSIKTTNN